MSQITRRNLAYMGLGLPVMLLSSAAVSQESGKPEIKWSEAEPIIKKYVEQLSEASKQSTGIEFTTEQKTILAQQIRQNMDVEHLFAFVDP